MCRQSGIGIHNIIVDQLAGSSLPSLDLSGVDYSRNPKLVVISQCFN